MMREIFATHVDVQQTAAAQHYLQALRHIINHDEEATGVYLNKCRDVLLEGRHWTKLDNADIQSMLPDPDFTVERFYALYGDYKSFSKSAWVRDPEVLAMIGYHIALLGDHLDQANFAQMICRNMKEYGLISTALGSAPAAEHRLAYN